MKKHFAFLLLIFLVGCSANPSLEAVNYENTENGYSIKLSEGWLIEEDSSCTNFTSPELTAYNEAWTESHPEITEGDFWVAYDMRICREQGAIPTPYGDLSDQELITIDGIEAKKMKVQTELSTGSVIQIPLEKEYIEIQYRPSPDWLSESYFLEIFETLQIETALAVTWKGQIIEEADPATFEELSQEDDRYGYAKDANNVYFWNENTKTVEILERVNAETFELLSKNYAKDLEYVYKRKADGLEVFQGADASTFEVTEDEDQGLATIEARDKNFVYLWTFDEELKTESLLKADSASFMILNEYYAKDKNHIFKIEGGYSDLYFVLEGADPASFKVLEFAYGSDGERIYTLVLGYEWYNIEEIKGASPESFQPITMFVSKDQNHIFIETDIFEGPNPASFVSYGTDEEHPINDKQGFFHDDQNVYYLRHNSGIKLDPVDVNTFEVIPTNSEHRPLGKDKNSVYMITESEINEVQGLYEMKVITLEIDIDTFKYIGDETYESILQDKNGTWALDWRTGELRSIEI